MNAPWRDVPLPEGGSMPRAACSIPVDDREEVAPDRIAAGDGVVMQPLGYSLVRLVACLVEGKPDRIASPSPGRGPVAHG